MTRAIGMAELRRDPGQDRSRLLHLLLGTYLALWIVAVPSSGQTVPPLLTGEWRYDIIHRTRGRAPLKGLVTEQTKKDVLIKRVFRKPGSPTVILEDRVSRDEVAQLELLDAEERELLTKRLDTLVRERTILQAQTRLWTGKPVEFAPGETVPLKPAEWPAGGSAKALAYESTYFRLVSTAREDIVRLTAIQLEQVFTAYSRCLPPREDRPVPTTILLTRSLAEYTQLVKARGHNILNPAFFDPKEQQVVCGCDLERLGEELARVQAQHAELYEDLDDRRRELMKIYNRQVPGELLAPIDSSLRKIRDLEDKNNDVVRIYHLGLVRCLCHEAFHAYLNASVFADGKARVPTWLDEGLAQIFETALVEGGELRIGYPDKERLRRVRIAVESEKMLPLTDLLRSTSRQFQVSHTQEKLVSDDHYLAAWALAFYLTFERQALGSEALDEYLQALNREADPLEAFQVLLGEPVARAEQKWHHYLMHLRHDGTVVPSK